MKYARWVLVSVALLVIVVGTLVTITPKRAYSYTSHATINADGNTQLASVANGGGAGTISNPYIIENYSINASSADGIYIHNTTAYFIIRNCLIENGSTTRQGIRLVNTINGTITNNILDNNYRSIGLSSSDNNILDSNTCYNDTSCGIWVYYSNHDNLINNTTYRTSFYGGGSDVWDNNGIALYGSYYDIIENNTCENSTHVAIKLGEGSYYDNIVHNICDNSKNGIYLDESTNMYNTIRNNTCEYEVYGICLDSATDDNNYIYNNTCRYNENFGIGSWEACSGNIITNNNCSNNQNLHGKAMGYGIYFDSGSNNNVIFYNYLSNNTLGNGYDAGSNAWDNQTSHRGNYWDNWQPGSGGRTSVDGIVVDNVYSVLGGTNKDNYPLVITSVYIEGNTQFDNAHGVNGGGAGTFANPYVIENKVISALASTYGGIYISNTTSYFVVRNCIVENGFTDVDGIHLNGVTNGRIENNICNNSDVNIYLAASTFDNIRNNTCSNGSEGIGFGSSSDNNIVANNRCENNIRGIYLYNASFNSLDNNICRYNSDDAIDLGTGADSNTLTNNTCDNNINMGIHLYHSTNDTIAYNICSYNSNTGIYVSEASPTNKVSSNTCDNNNYGIILSSCGTLENIDNNTCLSNIYYGISTENATYENITNNTCSYNIGIDNSGIGIYLATGSVYENIIGNTCENNGTDSIDLGTNSNYNYIYRNVCKDTIGQWSYDNIENIWTNGKQELHLYHANNNIIDNNTFSRTPPTSFVWDNAYDNWTNTQNNYGMALSSSSNNIISNNITINNISVGIHTGGGSDNNLIENNYCDSTFYGIARNGIAIYLENYSIVRNNICENSSHAGIKLGGSLSPLSGCYHDNILNNVCENNKNGIYVDETSNTYNLIENNICRYGKFGITLDSPNDNYNTIDNNTFEYNNNNISHTSYSPSGIFIDFACSNNRITNNICRYDNYGIYLTTAHNNIIFYNRILNNTENNAYDDSHNAWDNQTGTNKIGNYWSDWQPSNGHYDTDNNGIVDTPRPILAGSNYDNYPLVLEGEQVYYTLSLGMIGSGTVSENSSEPHIAGENVLLSATALVGWRFNHWRGAPIDGVTDNVISIIMGGNYTITAIFTTSTYTLTTSVTGSGSITVGSANPHPAGENVSLQAVADNGWRFYHWTGSLSGSDNTTSIIMDSDKTIGAVFTETTSEWPMFRHDTSATAYSTDNSPMDNHLLWRFAAEGNISPAIENGKLYVGANSNLYCLNTSTGAIIWDYATPDIVQSSPTVDNGRVYFGCDDDKIYCLNAISGTFVWSYTTGGNVYAPPLVDNGVVYIGSEDGIMYAINANTGILKWSYAPQFLFQQKQIVGQAAISNGKLYFGRDYAMFTCLNADNGSLIWAATDYQDTVDSGPLVTNSRVYYGTERGYLFCLNADNGDTIWNIRQDVIWLFNSPVMLNGILYLGDDNGRMCARNPDNGDLIWSTIMTLGYQACSTVSISANGLIYIGSQDGKIYAFDNSGSVIWSYNTGSRVTSSPALADNKLYITAANNMVYAFGAGQVYYNLYTSVTGSGSIAENTANPHAAGENVSIVATAASGWHLSEWTGDLAGSATSTSLIMNSDKTIVAVFVQDTQQGGGGGGGTPNPTPTTTPASTGGFPLWPIFIVAGAASYLLKQKKIAYVLIAIGVVILIGAPHLTVQQVIG